MPAHEGDLNLSSILNYGSKVGKAGESAGAVDVAGSRIERRKAETIGLILEAAERCFLRAGYTGARVEDIATDADVAVGSIYVHFGNKQGLYLALIERAIEAEESYLIEAFDPALPPRERLVASGTAYLRFFRDYPGYFRMLAFPQFDAAGTGRRNPIARRVEEMGERQIQRLRETIAEGVADGSLAQVDPARAALFLWGAWQGVMALTLRPGVPRIEEKDLESVLAEGRTLLRAGIVARTEELRAGEEIGQRTG